MPIILCLALLFATAVLRAQPDIPAALQPAPPDWKSMEIELPAPVLQALLDTVFHDEDLHLIGKRTSDIMSNIHVVDVDLDGRADIVYHGTNGGEIKRLVVFLGTDSGIVKVAAQWGELLAVRRNSPLEPLSFTIVDYPCCAGYTLYSTVYALARTGGTQHYEPVSCTAFTSTTTFPPEFTRATPVLITAKETDVRAMPEVSSFQPERLRGALPNPGNLLGMYPEGSMGVVLAEQTNADSERWLFVRLARNKPAQQDAVHRGQNGEAHFGMLGWVRANDTNIAP